MPAPHAFYSKMLAERTALRNVFVLFYFILFYLCGARETRVPAAATSALFVSHVLYTLMEILTA
jgi:hypothetical protein